MMRLRVLGFSGDTCCLPSPYRIPQRVAGMAFNFSKVEIAGDATRRAAESIRQAETDSTRDDTSRFFGLSQYAPAT